MDFRLLITDGVSVRLYLRESVKAIALYRNDLFIQFLVSSINLCCPQTTVKTFKTDADAKAWRSLRGFDE
jgi:hypothetical protein